MADEHFWDESTLDESEVAEGMKLASQELRAWLEGGFEQDLKRRGVEIAAAKRRGEYLATEERKQFERAFVDGANPAEVQAINAKLEALYSKPSLSRQEEAERVKLTKQLQSMVKRYPNSSSKKSMEW